MSEFLDAGERFLGLDDTQADPQRAGVVVIPVPFERTSSFGRGSAAGPAAILAASRHVELYDTDLGCEPWREAGGIATRRAVTGGDGPAVKERLERVAGDWLDRGRRVVTLAGEHTGVVGAVLAHGRRAGDLTVLQIDAHSDLRPSYLDDPWNHACTMARVLDAHRAVVQVGIRSESIEDAAAAREHRLPVFRAAGIHRDDRRGIDWVAPIVEACSDQVYVTFDCDALDPGVMPATGTPEPGGLSWTQVNELLSRLCAARRVTGFDLSELAPIEGVHHPQFTAARLVYRLIGLMSAGGPEARA